MVEADRQVKTVCRSCHGGCGVIATVKDGRVVRVEGDPDSPIGHGTMCSKGLSITRLRQGLSRAVHILGGAEGTAR